MSEERQKFNPREHVRTLSGRGGAEYLDVKWRIVWLREDHPDANVVTEMLELRENFALFKATVSYLEGAVVLAVGHGSETASDFGDFIEKAETKAVGRALHHLGYGTSGMPDDERIADAPVERQGVPVASNQPPPSLVRQGRATPARDALRPVVQDRTTDGINQEQLKAIANLWERTYGKEDIAKRLQADFGAESTDVLSQEQAAAFIQALGKEYQLTKAVAG